MARRKQLRYGKLEGYNLDDDVYEEQKEIIPYEDGDLIGACDL